MSIENLPIKSAVPSAFSLSRFSLSIAGLLTHPDYHNIIFLVLQVNSLCLKKQGFTIDIIL
jgi:hypothetical protein